MEITLTESAVELIQLSLAPIFLLVGIGQMVNVATGRLARIVDRARWFEDLKQSSSAVYSAKHLEEITALRRRMRFSNWAITLLTGSAVVVCIDVILLLVNGIMHSQLDIAIISMFIVGLLLITGGLGAFFFEVSLATASLKISSSDYRQ